MLCLDSDPQMIRKVKKHYLQHYLLKESFIIALEKGFKQVIVKVCLFYQQDRTHSQLHLLIGSLCLFNRFSVENMMSYFSV